MSKKMIALLALSALIISAILLYLAIPHLYINSFARTHDLNISYRGVRFEPHIGTKLTGGFKIDIYLKDVHISKKGALAGAYDNLGAMVTAPFDGSLNYREIKGTIRPRPGRLLIDDLIADSGDIKVSLSGTFFYTEDKADLEVAIKFSPAFLKKIPKELSESLLKKSPDGWSDLSIKVKGCFKSPAIEVTGRLFRLSIKEISGE